MVNRGDRFIWVGFVVVFVLAWLVPFLLFGNNLKAGFVYVGVVEDVSAEFASMKKGTSDVSSLEELRDVVVDGSDSSVFDKVDVYLTVAEDRESVVITVMSDRFIYGDGELSREDLLAFDEVAPVEADESNFYSIAFSFGGVLPEGFEGSVKVVS